MAYGQGLDRDTVKSRMYVNARKGEILIDTTGIICEGNVNIASPESAFLETLCLD